MIDPEEVFTKQSGSYHGVTGISETGSLVAIGEHNGRVALFSESGSSSYISAQTSRSVSHISISEDGPKGILAFMDGGIVMGFGNGETWTHQYNGLWDIAPVHDLGGACVCTRPREGPGTIQYVKDNEEMWKKPLENAVGERVSASQDAGGIAVATGHYHLDEDPLSRFGTPGIIFYEWGEQEWSKETEEDVIGLVFDSDNDRVTAGLDNGSIVSYSLDGEVLTNENGVRKATDKLWSGQDEGGFLSVSEDHTSIVSHTLGVLRCFDTRGNLQWKANIEGMSRDERSVQVDRTGNRVLVTTIDEHAYLVERGECVWEESYPRGPVWGSLSTDGSTWCIAHENLDTQITTLNVYRDPEHGR